MPVYLTDEDLTPTDTIIDQLLALRAVAPGSEAPPAGNTEAHVSIDEELAMIDDAAPGPELPVTNANPPREVTPPQADLQRPLSPLHGVTTQRATLSTMHNQPGRVGTAGVAARAALYLAIDSPRGPHIYLIPQLPLHATSPYVSQVLQAIIEANPEAAQALAAAGPGYGSMIFSTGSQPLDPLPSGLPPPDAQPCQLGMYAIAARLRLHPVGESQAREGALRNAGVSPQTPLLILYMHTLGNLRSLPEQEEVMPIANSASNNVSDNHAEHIVTPLTFP